MATKAMTNLSVDKDLSSVLDTTDMCGDLSEGSCINMIPLGKIFVSDNNIFLVEDDITDLAEDIKVNGLLTPLTVCPAEEDLFYRLISGHRRYKALCSIYDDSFEVPCLITWPKSPEAEEYMLIRANTASRVLSYNEIDDSRKKAEELLLKLKAQGVEMPGKLRKHVAELLKISEAKLAKIKYINEHSIDELKTVSDDVLSFDGRYKVAHWPEDMQRALYEKKLKDRKSFFYDINYLNDKIKSGEDPFSNSTVASTPSKKLCYYLGCNYGNSCTNLEVFKSYKNHNFNRFGVVYKCNGSCCWWCPERYICPGVCASAKEHMNDELLDYEPQFFYVNRIVMALRALLGEKGFSAAKCEDLLDLDNFDIEYTYNRLYRDPYAETFDIMSLLWYLSQLKMTPNEFFEYVEKHTDNIRKLEEGEEIRWKIYLGEEKK